MAERMNEIIAGSLAGLAATGPMTAVMFASHRRLPPREQYPLPPRQIVDRLIDETGIDHQISEPQRQATTWVSHFAYGALAGALYARVVRNLSLHPLAKGSCYGMAVWAGSYLGWLPAAGILPPATQVPGRRNLMMIASHLIWGAAAGLLAAKLTERKQGRHRSGGE